MDLFDHRSSVFASGGMVAASSPLATQAGLRVLADGGNAVDAALATAAVVGVVEPMMNGLGGDMWAMVWWEDDQRVHGLNASGRCPEGLTAGRFAGRPTMPQAGWKTVTSPGACDGYSVLHERCSPSALIPFFWLTTYQTAANQLTTGVRVLSMIVPAVTDVSCRHAAQRRSPSPIRQYSPQTWPQNRHENPSPQRSRSRYLRHAPSSGNHDTSSW